MMTKLASACAVVVLLFAGPVPAQTPSDRLIVAGAHIGRWTLEMSLDDLLRMNGTPTPRRSILSEVFPSTAWHFWEAFGLGAAVNEQKMVQFLAVAGAPDYKTAGGIGHGSSRQAVLRAHGAPTVTSDIFVQGRILTRLVYNEAGLAFVLHRDGVEVIFVFPSGGGQHLIDDC